MTNMASITIGHVKKEAELEKVTDMAHVGTQIHGELCSDVTIVGSLASYPVNNGGHSDR